MAKAKKGAIMTWDQEMAAAAETGLATVEGIGGGNKFFSLKNGQLSFDDNPLPDNRMVVFIVDYVNENLYYDQAYDSANPAPPACYAFGRSLPTMAPHEQVDKKEHENCAECWANKWPDEGGAKPCKNTMRLAMIAAGTINHNDDVTYYAEPGELDSDIAFLKLPVTSVRGFAGIVNKVAKIHRRPLFGVYMLVSVVPDDKSQFKVIFEPLENTPETLKDKLMEKITEAKSIIDLPYQAAEKDDTPKKKPAKKGGVKKKTGKAKGRKF